MAEQCRCLCDMAGSHFGIMCSRWQFVAVLGILDESELVAHILFDI